MLALNQVQKNPQVLEFIKQSDAAKAASEYTEHSLSHAKAAQFLGYKFGLVINNFKLL